MKKLVTGCFLCTTYTLAQAPTYEMYPKTVRCMFEVRYLDRETSHCKAQTTGFFVSNDGLGLTSGPTLDSMKGTRIELKLFDNAVIEAEGLCYEELPGIGFLQTKGPTKDFLKVSRKGLCEGEFYFTAGVRNRKTYFRELFVSDTKHPWVRPMGKEVFVDPVALLTPEVPEDCIGGPVLDQDGNAVAVLFKLSRGMPVAIPLDRLATISTQPSSWKFTQLWRNARQSIEQWLYT